MAFDSVKFHGINKFLTLLHKKVPLNIWVQRYEDFIREIGQKEFKIGPQTFEYSLNMIRPGKEIMEFFNWNCLSYYRSFSNFLICFLLVSEF